MRAAIDPVVALAIAKQKLGIKVLNRGGRGGVDLGRIAGERRLGILGQFSNRVQGEGQQRDRHGRRHGCTRGDGVIEDQRPRRARRAELASHFERAHRGPAVGWRSVGNQDKGLRGIRGPIAPEDVQVVPQRVGPAVEHQGVLFIRVKPRQGPVVLHVELTCHLGGTQVARTRVRGEDDLVCAGIRDRRIDRRINTFLGRQIKGIKISARRRDGFQPPDRKRRGARQGIDGDNRARARRGHTHRQRIDVGLRKMIRPRLEVPGRLIARWRHQPLADDGRTRERGRAVRLLKARAGDRLRGKPNIPHLAPISKFQEGAIETIRARVDHKALRIHVDLGFTLGGIVLENHGRQTARRKLHPSRRRTPGGRDNIMSIARKCRGPDLFIGVLDLWPIDTGHHRAARRRISNRRLFTR